MPKALFTFIFVLAVAQASVFGYALNMNNRLEVLEAEFEKANLKGIIGNQQYLHQENLNIFKILRGLIIQVQSLKIEKDKVQKQEMISKDNLKIG